MAKCGEGTVWYQREISLKPVKRGCHVITDEITDLSEIKKIKIGICHILLKHTSASIVLNESWDSEVRIDMEMVLNKLIPENLPYKHTLEGPDDMPAHAKTAFLSPTVTIPITNGKLNIGTWQGLWLCEHRNQASSRHIVVTVQGAPL